MSAPRSISTFTASALPAAAANINAVVPFDVLPLTSAPALMSGSITAALPFFAASRSGVYELMRVDAFTLAPAYSSVSAREASLRIAAQCSAVIPSACDALTSAACFNSDRTASLSPACAASATGDGGAAPRSTDKPSDISATLTRISFCRISCLLL